MATWTRLPAIEGTYGGCLKCGPRPSVFEPDAVIAVGFGAAFVTRDGGQVYYEPRSDDPGAEYLTGEGAEAMAAADPDHDWRIHLYGPLSGRVYQRHEPGQWVLIEQDAGFA